MNYGVTPGNSLSYLGKIFFVPMGLCIAFLMICLIPVIRAISMDPCNLVNERMVNERRSRTNNSKTGE